ncbi:ribokinase [Pediococcus claussenii]|uniref:Ribokinase n=1 Tax=Pediococcus claussenii (strain ATCC BAA-344 / DSM 14800 / JCM 18046 / KCTC 3811 / LMG 21948 / P06) TaxID=701521 RepID=G8PEY9_PEDCP|nr:ribokinase [Pediococcus claussenii]AEV95668.1 ribokinase [Pediococcus claussenii ATCC BAA-344]ANZ69181.1 ribokinase [Pediococcus claussenii]ANZ70998.1 ribokinase [Pediococcus claussenii]KRN20099.1 rbsK protein [Pediococcus claussenii]
MTKKIAVLGSLNVDMILRLNRMPQPGETLAVSNKSSAAGGKGANQAVASARSGAAVRFIGRVGDDDEGRFMIDSLKEDQIDTVNIKTDKRVGTGSAVILLDDSGQNDILVYGGANQRIAPEDISEDVFNGIEALIAQFETPQDVTLKAFQIAKTKGILTVLNPAPAQKINPDLLKVTDLVIPNETESAALTGIEVIDEESMEKTAESFRGMGVKNLIITIGSKGAFYSTDNESGFMKAFKVKAVDTTAAGDTFIGALTSQLNNDLSNIKDALEYGQRASSLTVQKLGAMPSIPTREEVLSTK